MIKIDTYETGNILLDRIMLANDHSSRSKDRYTITELTTSVIPQIAAGSVIDQCGAMVYASSNESIATTDPYTGSVVADGPVFIIMTSLSGIFSASFTATAPVWSDAKQGYYGTGGQVAAKYLSYTMIKSGSSYTYKFKSLLQPGS